VSAAKVSRAQAATLDVLASTTTLSAPAPRLSMRPTDVLCRGRRAGQTNEGE
jgi:hypothetical protein